MPPPLRQKSILHVVYQNQSKQTSQLTFLLYIACLMYLLRDYFLTFYTTFSNIINLISLKYCYKIKYNKIYIILFTCNNYNLMEITTTYFYL